MILWLYLEYLALQERLHEFLAKWKLGSVKVADASTPASDMLGAAR